LSDQSSGIHWSSRPVWRKTRIKYNVIEHDFDKFDNVTQHRILDWLRETYGPSSETTWCWKNPPTGDVILVMSDEIATMFMLRWL
jgi:hypothetical protein